MAALKINSGLTTAAKLRIVIASLLLVNAVGTFGFMYLEGMSPIEGLYMTVITLSTVGFSEVRPLHDASKLFVIGLIFFGVLLAGMIVTLMGQVMLEGHFQELVSRRKMEQKLKKLNDHFIIAGFGRVGRQVAQEFARRKAQFVVIEMNTEAINKCILDGYPFLQGNDTDEEVLAKAGIDKARTLISTLPDEAQNVYLTLTARFLQPKINIIARADFEDGEKKLMRAGADHVVIPHVLGGIRMAMATLQPHVVDFMSMTSLGEEGLIVEELAVPENSHLVGKTLIDSNLKKDYEVTIIGVKHPKGRMEINPGPKTELNAGDIIVLIGDSQKLEQLSRDLRQ